LKKKLPAFIYDEASIKEDLEREVKKIVKDSEWVYEG